MDRLVAFLDTATSADIDELFRLFDLSKTPCQCFGQTLLAVTRLNGMRSASRDVFAQAFARKYSDNSTNN